MRAESAMQQVVCEGVSGATVDASQTIILMGTSMVDNLVVFLEQRVLNFLAAFELQTGLLIALLVPFHLSSCLRAS